MAPAGIPTDAATIDLLLSSPATSAEYVPAGADRTMTTTGPDQVWFLVVAITCIGIPGLFLIMRLYTKIAIVRSFEVADYFVLLAYPLIVVEIVLGWKMISWGSGVHNWQVTLNQVFNQLYWANLAQIIYCPLSFFVKMAILLQYLRLFAPSRAKNAVMWYGAWLTITLCFIFYTFFMFWTMYYCKPRRMIWDKFTPGGKCHNANIITLSQGGFNMASDIVILLLPTSSLWRMDIPLAKKMVITLLFATGLLACAASAMRIFFTTKMTDDIARTDVSHHILFIGLWTEVEVSLAFIVACALCIPRLLRAKGAKIKRVLTFQSFPKSTRSMLQSASDGSSDRSSTQSSTLNSTNSIQVAEINHTWSLSVARTSSEYSRSISGRSAPEDINNDYATPLATPVRMTRYYGQQTPVYLDGGRASPRWPRDSVPTFQEFNFRLPPDIYEQLKRPGDEPHRSNQFNFELHPVVYRP